MSDNSSSRVRLWRTTGFGLVSNSKDSGDDLYEISIGMLSEGMEIKGDIFAFDKERVLIKGGTLLNEKIIKMVENFNNGNHHVFVAEDTLNWIYDWTADQSASESLNEMEEATGYGDIKDETFGLLDEITQKQSLRKDALYSVSDKLSEKLEEVAPAKIISLVNALAPVDEYLQRHCLNVSLLNGMFGKWLGLGSEDVDRLMLCGLLHDCGKALIPPQILNVQRKLMAVEFEVIKMHTIHSYNLLSDFPEPVRMAARAHHEKVGEKGYPDGMPPDKIPMEARVTAVSDIYDAMVSQRAYKEPRSPFGVMAMLLELRGVDLDRELVDIFVRNMPHELLNREVIMSDGTIGIVHSYDINNIEYPVISINGHLRNSDEEWYCLSMYNKN